MKKVMYIAINKDLNMSPGKIGAHSAHATFDYLYDEYISELIETGGTEFYHGKTRSFKHEGDTIVLLQASEKEMLKLKEKGYTAVIDSGRTEVEPNSLTAINLGIYDKDEEVPKFIQRLRLYQETKAPINLEEEDLAKHVICMAIGRDNDRLDKMLENNKSMTKDIRLIVDGVELDFMNVINSINKKYEYSVKDCARNHINSKFYRLDNLLNDLKDQVNEQIDVTEVDLRGGK